MSDPTRSLPAGHPSGAAERGLLTAAKAMAFSGSFLFLVLVSMSLISIVGRKLGFGSVNGDIELMQAGTAVAAAAFLPYCTIMSEHLKVDFFTENLSARNKRRLDASADLILAAAAAILAWRTGLSAQSIYEAGEVTTLVSLPVWIPVVAIVPSLALMSLCALYRAFTPFTHAETAQ